MTREIYNYVWHLEKQTLSEEEIDSSLQQVGVSRKDCKEFYKFLKHTTELELDKQDFYVPLTESEYSALQKNSPNNSLKIHQFRDPKTAVAQNVIQINKGDSLSKIAQEFDISENVVAILAGNRGNIFAKSADLILQGGYLFVPTPAVVDSFSQQTQDQNNQPPAGASQTTPSQTSEIAELNNNSQTQALIGSITTDQAWVDSPLADQWPVLGFPTRRVVESTLSEEGFQNGIAYVLLGPGANSIDIRPTADGKQQGRVRLGPPLASFGFIFNSKGEIPRIDLQIGTRPGSIGVSKAIDGSTHAYERIGLGYFGRVKFFGNFVSVKVMEPGRVLTGVGQALEVGLDRTVFEEAMRLFRSGEVQHALDLLWDDKSPNTTVKSTLLAATGGKEDLAKQKLKDILNVMTRPVMPQFMGEVLSYMAFSSALEKHVGLDAEETANQSLALGGSLVFMEGVNAFRNFINYGYIPELAASHLTTTLKGAGLLMGTHLVVGEGLDHVADQWGLEENFKYRAPLHLMGDGLVYAGATGVASVIKAANFTSVFDDAAKVLSTTTTATTEAVLPTTTARVLAQVRQPLVTVLKHRAIAAPLAATGTAVNVIGTAGMAVAIADGFTNMVAPSVVATVTAGGAEDDYEKQQARTELAWHIIQQEQTDPNFLQGFFPNVDTLIKLTNENLFTYGVSLFDETAATQITQGIKQERVDAHAKVIQAVVEHLEQSFAGTTDVEIYWHAKEQKETRALTRLVATAYPEASPLLALYLQAFHDNGKIKDANVIAEMQNIIAGKTSDTSAVTTATEDGFTSLPEQCEEESDIQDEQQSFAIAEPADTECVNEDMNFSEQEERFPTSDSEDTDDLYATDESANTSADQSYPFETADDEYVCFA